MASVLRQLLESDPYLCSASLSLTAASSFLIHWFIIRFFQCVRGAKDCRRWAEGNTTNTSMAAFAHSGASAVDKPLVGIATPAFWKDWGRRRRRFLKTREVRTIWKFGTDLPLALAPSGGVSRWTVKCFWKCSLGTHWGRGRQAQGNTSHAAALSITRAPSGAMPICELFPGLVDFILMKACFLIGFKWRQRGCSGRCESL